MDDSRHLNELDEEHPLEVQPTDETGEVKEVSSPPRPPSLATGAGLLVIGLLVGTIAVTAAQAAMRGEGSTASSTSPQAGSPPLGQRGGTDEQRVLGTVASVGATSVTVTTGSGASTFQVDRFTDIRRDGRPVALTALAIGDPVLVHALPSGSRLVAERVLAGTSVSDGGPGSFGPPPPGAGPGVAGGFPT